MPGLARRREVDLRSDRLESEVRDQELYKLRLGADKGLPYCSKCRRAFEEKSRYCPRCDTKTMGLVKMIPEQFREEARRKALARARARI